MTDSLLSNAAEWRLNWSCALSLFFRIFPLGGCEDSARPVLLCLLTFPISSKIATAYLTLSSHDLGVLGLKAPITLARGGLSLAS